MPWNFVWTHLRCAVFADWQASNHTLCGLRIASYRFVSLPIAYILHISSYILIFIQCLSYIVLANFLRHTSPMRFFPSCALWSRPTLTLSHILRLQRCPMSKAIQQISESFETFHVLNEFCYLNVWKTRTCFWVFIYFSDVPSYVYMNKITKGDCEKCHVFFPIEAVPLALSQIASEDRTWLWFQT